MTIGFPKPEPRKRTKGRKLREEATVAQHVRERVADRDGDCRLKGVLRFGPCSGESEWAHLTKRSQTRGLPPEERHSTMDSVMFCTGHHQSGPINHEHGTLKVEKLTAKGADGPLKYYAAGIAPYTEVR